MARLLVALALIAAGCDKQPAQTPSAAAAHDAAPAVTAPPPAPTPPAPEKAAWVEYVHPDKLIAAKFPKAPKEQKQQAPSPIGPIDITMAMHAEQTRAYMVGASRYQLPAGGTFDTAKALEGARTQMLGAIRAKAIAEKPIQLDGLDGSEITFEAPGPNPSITVRGVARVFAGAQPPAGYFATAFRMTEAEDPDAATFLDSVRVGKGAGAP